MLKNRERPRGWAVEGMTWPSWRNMSDSRMKLQLSSTLGELSGHARKTRREVFLGEMDGLVPWADFVELLKPFCGTHTRGRPQLICIRMELISCPLDFRDRPDLRQAFPINQDSASQALNSVVRVTKSVTATWPACVPRDRPVVWAHSGDQESPVRRAAMSARQTIPGEHWG